MATFVSHAFDRILEPVARALNPEAARKLIRVRPDRKTRAHVDRLARKCNEGRLSPQEQSEYEGFVSAIDLVAVLQAKARAQLARSAT